MGKVRLREWLSNVLERRSITGSKSWRRGRPEIVLTGKGDNNRTAGNVHVWGVITNDCGKVAVLGSVKVVGVSYSTAQFDGFKRFGVVKRMVFSH
jgi:hypothetical protein